MKLVHLVPDSIARVLQPSSHFPHFLRLPDPHLRVQIMPGDETRSKPHDDSDSEDESDSEPIVSVDIDPSKLTPLSPEVISKQVRLQVFRLVSISYDLTGHNQSRYAFLVFIPCRIFSRQPSLQELSDM